MACLANKRFIQNVIPNQPQRNICIPKYTHNADIIRNITDTVFVIYRNSARTKVARTKLQNNENNYKITITSTQSQYHHRYISYNDSSIHGKNRVNI